MKVKLDENIPVRLVDVLSHMGHDVDTVNSEGLTGRPDADFWDASQRDGRLLITQEQRAASETMPVTVKNFARAESDLYFAKSVKEGAFGKLRHDRAPVSIEKQKVVRMNRDTLYSSGVFDLDTGPVTITLPDPGKRFMSVLVITEDHYAPLVANAPGTHTIDKVQAGTRYMMLTIRTFADPTDPADVVAANALQDRIQVSQPGGPGTFEIPR
jgi:hypothetical protein